MKPTSIIFLIVSVALVIAGMVTLSVAQSMAHAEGVELLAKTEEGSDNIVFQHEYDADSIGRIRINVKNADVNIIGSSSRAYIELINFPEGMYEFSSANRILTVDNNSDLSSLENVAALAFSFKGLRSIINYFQTEDKPQTVNIYISDEYPVKIIDCILDAGSVRIENSSLKTDYNVKIGAGNLDIEAVSTTSVVNAEIGAGDVTITDGSISTLELLLDAGSFKAENTEISMLNAEIEAGDFTLTSPADLELLNLTLSTGAGRILLNGEEQGNTYRRDDIPVPQAYKIAVGAGDISIQAAQALAQALPTEE